MDAEKIGKVIKDCRKEKGMTQKELAEKTYDKRQDYFKMGERSFPNKRILRNNLCLPACKNIIFQLGRDTTRLS
ncbi:helix-turn-helix domain-containing protein [Peptacetobacter hiranonis]|nr:helix-turn-helix transcriptional regulator [Peptacetobacter hiranonis]